MSLDFDALFRTYNGKLLGFIRKHCRFDADDIGQQAWLRAITFQHKLKQEKYFFTWICKISLRLIATQAVSKHNNDISLSDVTTDEQAIEIGLTTDHKRPKYTPPLTNAQRQRRFKRKKRLQGNGELV